MVAGGPAERPARGGRGLDHVGPMKILLALSASAATLAAGAATTSASPERHCVVPRLYGLALGGAGAALTRAGCTVGAVSYERPRMRVARVTDQVPPPGAVLPRRARVFLIVS